MPDDSFFDRIIADTRPVIEVDGMQHDMIASLLTSMEMRETTGGLAAVELRFDNTAEHDGVGVDFAFEYAETDLLALGAGLRVLVGAADDPMEIFRGRISAVELVVPENGQPELCVHAEDALMVLRMNRRSRSFGDQPVRDIVTAIARDAGLTPVVTGLTEMEREQRQRNESDLAFLRRLLAVYDADLQVVGTELHVSPREQVDRGAVSLTLGGLLLSLRVVADLAHQRARVTVSGFDPRAGTDIDVAFQGDGLGPGRASGDIHIHR